jgi:CheY-like chemotaxis protein
MFEEKPPSPRRLRILLVDDEPSVLAAYRRSLAGRFEVVVAAGGREALELLAWDHAFDAIVCDVMMPEVDGPAVWSHLADHHPDLARRTAFCTAGAYTPRTIAFTEAMQDRLITKPVEPEHLARFVARLAGR